MSKVFSNKRIDSIKKLKVKKYIVYAVGEILIVSIGIVLAIYFNNLKEEKVNRKYIDKVLNDVNAETKRYINSSIFFLEYNAERDSLVRKILHGDVKKEDYSLLGTDHLNILRTLSKLEFDNTPLDNLNRRIDFLSKKEKKVYDLLAMLKSNQEGYQPIFENPKEILNEYKQFQKENHEWFYLIGYDSIADQKEFDYRLKSYRYKNFVRDYSNYEILHKSNSYSFLQVGSIITYFKVIEAQKKYELDPNQMDSILTSLSFKKLPNISCDATEKIVEEKFKLFGDNNFYNLILNGSQDTIHIKNEDNQILANIKPRAFTTIQVPNETNLKVIIDGKCVAKYSTFINSHIFYE